MRFAKLANFGAALAMGAASLTLAAPAEAQSRSYRAGDYYRDGYRTDYRRGDYYRDSRAYDRGYSRDRGAYYRGNDYRYRCRNDGAAGTIIGAVAGGLLGHEVVGRRGDKTAGTIVGGAVGAIAGRAIDKGDGRC